MRWRMMATPNMGVGILDAGMPALFLDNMTIPLERDDIGRLISVLNLMEEKLEGDA